MKLKKSTIILLLAIVFSIFLRFWQFRSDFLTTWDPSYWQKRYHQSQWFDPESKTPIGDDGLYAYAGWAYWHGADPTTINPEVPPLGKYLIGLTWVVLGNPAWFGLISFVLMVFGLYLLSNQVLKNQNQSLAMVFIISLQSLFWKDIRAPLLDLLYLSFWCFSSYFFLKKSRLRFVFSSLFIGLMMSTKLSFLSLLLIFTQFASLVFTKEKIKKILTWLTSLSVSGLVFLSSYWRYLLNGHSVLDVVRVQKWVFNFYSISQAKGGLVPLLKLIFLNQWLGWWGGQAQKVGSWSIVWPIAFLANLLGLFWLSKTLVKLKKIKKSRLTLTYLIVWQTAYIVFLSITPVWPRYLILYIPMALLTLPLLLRLKDVN